MLIRLALALSVIFVAACTATEFKVEQGSDALKPVATLEVKTRSITDYLTENIRIKHIQKTNGEVVLQHPWYLPHTVTAHIEAPESYEVTLLCEKPFKLRFEHSSAMIQTAPGCYYTLSCDWSSEPAAVIATPNC